MRRQQKKVLSLVLCVAMMLSVMVVGAGAAFSDQSKIKNTEAVDACTALNIIGGYPDGSFKPEGNITRAEVTKMICVALNGGKNPAVSTNTTPTFSDVRNNANAAWAEGYIESCAAQGIVSGVGGGKFAPNGNVTGVQLAKMLLVSLGYKSENEGFTGNAWATNVNVRAAQKGLYAGLEKMDSNAAITRDNAARMVWNALQAYEVEYKTDLVADKNGKLSTQITVQDKMSALKEKITLLEDKYEAKKVDVGQLLGCSKVDGKDYYSISTSAGDKSYNKIYADVSDFIGQNIKVLRKVDATSGEVTVYGVYADEDSKVVATSTVGTLDTVKNESAKVKVDGTEYKTDNNLTNVQVIYPNKKSVPTALNTLSKVVEAKDDYSAYAIKLIDNDGNNKIDTVVVTPKDVKEVTYVGSSSATVGGKSYKFDNADIYKNIAKDDWAVIVSGDYTVTGDPIITKADSVSGKVEGTKSGEVKINGTWYKVASTVTTAPSVDDKVEAAVVGNYVYNIDTTGAASKNILFISANDAADLNLGKDYTVEARAYFTDGSNKKIVVDKLNSNDLTNKCVSSTKTTLVSGEYTLADTMYTYATDKDGNYELKNLVASGASKNLAGYDKYNTTATSYTSAADTDHGITAGPTAYQNKRLNGTLIADDAILFVSAGSEIKVISGKTARDWADTVKVTNKGFLTKESNGIDYVKVAALTTTDSKVANADGDKLYAYVTEDAFETKKDGDTVTAFKAIVGNTTEAVALYEDGTSHVGTAAGSVIVYTVDGDKITVKAVVDATKYMFDGINGGAYAIKGFDGKKKGDMSLVKADGSIVNATLDEDCVFIGVDDAKNVGTTSNIGAVPTTADKDEYDRYDMNAYVVFNSANKVIAVVYDTVNNELDINNVKTASTANATSITPPTAITAVTPAGGYTFALDNTSAKPGATVKLTITCGTAPTAGKDTITVKNGDTTVGSVTFDKTGTAVLNVTVANGTNTLTASITHAAK